MAQRRPIAIGRHLWGIAASLVTGLAGGWLMVAPFAIGYQNGGSWTDATKNDFWTGLAVVVLSVIGLALFTLSLIGELRAAGVLKPRQQPVPQMPAWVGGQAPVSQQPAATPATASSAYHDELERTMALLATTLAAELAERRQARTGSNSQQPVTSQMGGQQS